MMKKLPIALAMLAGALSVSALTVDSTVSDNCVLLQNAPNIVKGTAAAGRTVTVTFGGQKAATATADASGNFKASFNPGAASATPRTIEVTDGTDKKTISNVLVGEVWLVAGQSNAYNSMDFNEYEAQFDAWMKDIDYPNIRVATSEMRTSASWGFKDGPNDPARGDISIPLTWEVVNSANRDKVKKISPLAFFFARELHKGRNVPVGITVAGYGATWIGMWMSPEALAAARKANAGFDGACCNGVHAPHISRFDDVNARGAIWFQGETDAVTGCGRYKECLRAMINDWRSPAHRNKADFPVLIVGLANFKDRGADGQTPGIRVIQEQVAAEMKHVYCIPSIDLSDNRMAKFGYGRSEHPDQKPELAARLFRAARAVVYGESALRYRCPYPTEAFFNADKTKIIVQFPESAQLHQTGPYSILPFRVKGPNAKAYATPVLGADKHSIELAWNGLGETPTSVAYCFQGGADSEAANIYEMKIFDQDNFPLPPFELKIADKASRRPVKPTAKATATKVPSSSPNVHQGVQLWANGPFWATTNLGAEKETDFGYYYLWGGTEGRAFDRGWKDQNGKPADYPFNAGALVSRQDANGNLEPECDAAHVLWGGSWRLPTAEERDKLSHECTFTWTTVDGVAGGRFTGKGAFADKSIFIPAAGYARPGGPAQAGQIVYLYTGTAAKGDASKAACFWFNSGMKSGSGTIQLSNNHRNNGYVIRAVCDDGTPVKPAARLSPKEPPKPARPVKKPVATPVAPANAVVSSDSHIHTWGTPRYVWAADYSTCTATATCTADASHTIVKTAKATRKVTQAATDTEAGRGYCTAIFTTAPFSSQAKVVTIPVKGAEQGAPVKKAPPAPPATARTAAAQGTKTTARKSEKDPLNGHQGVQLWANGPFWATMNLGAEKVTDYGYYYLWGGVVGHYYAGGWKKQDGTPVDCPFGNGDAPSALDANGNLLPENDAAHVLWSGNWRLPTVAERDKLKTECTFAWTTVDGVAGGRFTGKGAFADKSIFIPGSGYALPNGQAQTGAIAYLYTATYDPNDAAKAAAFQFNTGSTALTPQYVHRNGGYALRAVCDPAK